MLKKAIVVGFVLALAAFASANGAMGLALEIFDYQVWTVYVIATVILEAWFMGRSLRLEAPLSLGISILANIATACCCMLAFPAPFLHSYVFGQSYDPNPLAHTIFILVVFGLISGYIETFFWGLVSPRLPDEPKDVAKRRIWGFGKGTTLWYSLRAHALGVPLALVILLSSPEPYLGIEHGAAFWREFPLRKSMREALTKSMDDEGVILPIKSLEDLAARSGGAIDPKSVEFFQPTYGRFSTSDTRSKSWRFVFSEQPLRLDFDGQIPIVQVFEAGSTWPLVKMMGDPLTKEESRAAYARAAETGTDVPVK